MRKMLGLLIGWGKIPLFILKKAFCVEWKFLEHNFCVFFQWSKKLAEVAKYNT
jgi:hypothetical protein